VEAASGDTLEPDATFETVPSVLFDAVVVPDGERAADELRSLGHALEFLKDQYRHCKPILMLGAGEGVVKAAGVPTDDESDWAMVRAVPGFMEAVGKHRNWDRATDPPRI
jgi:catalase